MIVGFNHNILYRGVGFHVQTEDSGLKSPNLVTLLYHGGIIVTSQKTSYADILTVDELDQVVEELAKEQHKGMLRRLTRGEFDQRICALGIEIEGVAPLAAESPVVDPVGSSGKVEEAAVAEVAAVDGVYEESSVVNSATEEPLVAIEPAFEPLSAEDRNPQQNVSEALDDLIFSYLTGGDEEG
ncbi:MAG: hypothetical protein L3J63_02110 [Geopsychrobacter sp.]|nr:hypothetical protein [Geopsychrobacter sp.]